MNINTSSTYTYGSSSSKGMSGLASGLDTESLVKEMLSGTQSKIDAQEALKQQTEWKQEIYRDLIGQINNLQSTYFSSSSASSLTNSAFYNTMSAASTSKNFKVTAGTSAAAGNTTLEVHQLASSYSLASSAPVSGRLAGSFDPAALQTLLDDQRTADRTLVLSVGGADTTASKEVSIDLNSFFKNADGSLVTKPDANGIASAIQAALKDQAGLSATVTIEGGQLSIVTKNDDAQRSLSVSSSSTEQALTALGLSTSSEAKVNVGKTQRSLSGKVDLAPSLSFNVSLDDGLQKAIKLDTSALVDADGKLVSANLTKALTDAFDKQFGKGAVRVSSEGGANLSITTAVPGRKLVVYSGQNKEVLGALGLRNGQSNRVSLYDSLKQMPTATALQGKEFEFEINGVQFQFDEDDDIDLVMRRINASDAGVTMTYKPLDDTFVLTSNNSGAGYDIQMSQTKGNLLNVLLGSGADGSLAAGNTAVSAPLTASDKLTAGGSAHLGQDADDANLTAIKSGKFTLTVNGKEHTIQIPAKTGNAAYSETELVEELNKQLKDAFGETPNENLVDVQAIELVKDETTGKYTLEVRNGASVHIPATSADAVDSEDQLNKLAQEDGNLAVAFGFISKDQITNQVSGSTTLADAGLADLATALGVDASTTLDNLAQAVEDHGAVAGLHVSFEDGRLTFQAGNATDLTLDDPTVMQKLFGTSTLSLGTVPAGAGKAQVSEGKNAVVRIDGALTERSSNVFTYNGLTVELTGVSPVAEGGGSMKGTLMVPDGNGNMVEWKSVNGRWVDAEGYERASDGQYVAEDANGKGLRVPSLDSPVPDGFVLKHLPGAIAYDEDGNRMSGVGIQADGTLIDASGNPLQVRESETITVTRDTDKIVEGVKSFVDEYNKLVKTINDLLNEEATYREYAPLTDDQRKEMSEKQIELWEEKAKEGLLRRDSILDGFLRDIRSIWYETNSSGYAIYQLGIETGEWSTRGQLTFGQDGEATLRQMLASDPSGVMDFFANSVDGAAVRVNEVIRSVANTSSGSPGSLVELAGLKGMASEKNNTLYNKIQSIDEKIERLKDQYEQEKDRYWNQFNTMEQMIQNMNTQSAWLAQQFSY